MIRSAHGLRQLSCALYFICMTQKCWTREFNQRCASNALPGKICGILPQLHGHTFNDCGNSLHRTYATTLFYNISGSETFFDSRCNVSITDNSAGHQGAKTFPDPRCNVFHQARTSYAACGFRDITSGTASIARATSNATRLTILPRA